MKEIIYYFIVLAIGGIFKMRSYLFYIIPFQRFKIGINTIFWRFAKVRFIRIQYMFCFLDKRFDFRW